MAWFWIALTAPAAWAAANYIDKYMLSRYFQDVSVGVLSIFSSIIGFPIALVIFLIEPNVFVFSGVQLFMLVAAGFITAVGFIFYFFALEGDDTSLVVPLFQAIPVFGYLFGLLFLGEVLSPAKLLGGALIIAGAIGMTTSFTGHGWRFNRRVFWLMIASSALLALQSLLFKMSATADVYWPAMFWQLLGYGLLAAYLLLGRPQWRRDFVGLLRKSSGPILGLNLFNEALSAVGEFAISFAFLLAPLAVVWLINGFQPVFVFLYGIVLTLLFPNIIKEDLRRSVLLQKILFIAVIFAGTYLLGVQ